MADASAELHVSLGNARSHEHRPVFFMHGLGAHVCYLQTLISILSEAFPRCKLIALDVFEGDESSTTPLQTQVNGIISRIRATIAADSVSFAEGYDLVGHSLGGLLMRGVVESMDDHQVNTLISLAGVQGGVYCDNAGYPCDPRLHVPNISRIYTPEIQSSSSWAQLYRDANLSSFLQGNVFLPVLDGLLEDSGNQRRKSNFVRLKRAVFIGSPDDEMVIPPESQHLGFFGDGDLSTIIPMSKQDYYIEDTFGLRTLDETGRLSLIRVPGVLHVDWVSDDSVIREHVLPLLAS